MLVLPLGITWFLAAILALLDGRRSWVGLLGVAGLAAAFAVTVWLTTVVLQVGRLEMTAGGWPAGIGITLRLDALGALFAVTSLVVLLAALGCEVLSGVRARAFPALVLFLATGLNGLFLTGDAFNFYVFFEVSMIASFVLTGYGERSREMRATMIFVMVNLLGSVLFLAGTVALYHVTGTLDMVGISEQIGSVRPSTVILIASMILVAFAVKLGLFPFHFWLPAVYRDTRPVVAAILSGAVANIGGYGLLRFGGELLPSALEVGATALLVLGAASIVYGELLAISRYPTSEVLAYSSIGQVGYILIALAVGGELGYGAAILYAVANSLNKTLLFLATGLLGGTVGAAFAVGAFSVAGVPPSVGFFGKVAVFQAGIADGSAAIVCLVFVGAALSFVYMFQIYQRNFWRGRAPRSSSPLSARLLILGLAGLVVALGIWPEPLLAAGRQAATGLAGQPR
jgi:multicomponent Na+:H+ antiporter subunit D